MSHQPAAAPHAFVLHKDTRLDRDRDIPLTAAVAANFAETMNKELSGPKALAFFQDGKAELLAKVICEYKLFPFTASVEGSRIQLLPALAKRENYVPVLKDISDGVTEINKEFARQSSAGEGAKFTLAIMFQAAIYAAYELAKMEEGSHTKYTSRAC